MKLLSLVLNLFLVAPYFIKSLVRPSSSGASRIMPINHMLPGYTRLIPKGKKGALNNIHVQWKTNALVFSGKWMHLLPRNSLRSQRRDLNKVMGVASAVGCVDRGLGSECMNDRVLGGIYVGGDGEFCKCALKLHRRDCLFFLWQWHKRVLRGGSFGYVPRLFWSTATTGLGIDSTKKLPTQEDMVRGNWAHKKLNNLC